MTNKKGSTLLLALCLFFVFLIFVGALIPLSQRSFEKTATDVVQQQADYIAQSAVEAFISQLDQEEMRQILIAFIKRSDQQNMMSEWSNYNSDGEFRYIVSKDLGQYVEHPLFAWKKYRLLITAESRYSGKQAKISAAVQVTKYENFFFDPVGIEKELMSTQARAKRSVFINECRIPTKASANFWINAISDLTVTQENVNGQINSEPEKEETPDNRIDEKVVLIYRNIENPVVTGNIDGNIVLEPAEYTKATIGSNTPGEVVINGDVICKGDLILNNATINGAIYYSGTLTNKNSSYTGEVYPVEPNDSIFSYYQLNLPVVPVLMKGMDYENPVLYNDENIEISIDDSVKLIYECTNSNLQSLRIQNGNKRYAAYFNLRKMPESLIVESKNKNFRPVFFIDDENPVLSSQVTTNLLSSENIILVFTHPVRIQGDVNVSVFAPKIIFEAQDITMNGQIQACEFEHSELVSSVNLKVRNAEEMYFISKLDLSDLYYFDLLYYQK